LDQSQVRFNVLREFYEQKLKGSNVSLATDEWAKRWGVSKREIEVALIYLVRRGSLSGDFVGGTDVPIVNDITDIGMEDYEDQAKQNTISKTGPSESVSSSPDPRNVFVLHDKFQDTKLKFNDKAEDLLRSSGRTIENAINLFLAFCESDEITKTVTGPLKQNTNVNITKWYADFSKSAGSMSGSEKFLLPTDDDDRLALLYQLLLKIRSNEVSYHDLSFGAGNINAAASRFNEAISRPLIRGLSYRIEGKVRKAVSEKHARLERTSRISSNRVFVVHGHDETLKNEIEIFLGENGLEAVVLHRKPDQGRTIIEKLEQYSDVSYVFVLLTPDDIGYPKDEEEKDDSKRVKEHRARQNVIFELGYFVGLLGRNKVCCLYKTGVTLPTDFKGVLYKEVSTNIAAVAYDLLKELRAARLTSDVHERNESNSQVN
jgi:predicted nucleotide-binding protein